jgi:hypothetical protein
LRRTIFSAGSNLTEFIVKAAKAGGGCKKSPEATHRAVPGLDPSMALFNPVIAMLTGTMAAARTELDCELRADNGRVPPSSPAPGDASNRLGRPEQCSRGGHVAGFS